MCCVPISGLTTAESTDSAICESFEFRRPGDGHATQQAGRNAKEAITRAQLRDTARQLPMLSLAHFLNALQRCSTGWGSAVRLPTKII